MVRLVCLLVLIGCAEPRRVERSRALVTPRSTLAVSTNPDPWLEQRLAPRHRSASTCRKDSDCNEHGFGFCGYLSDDVDRNQGGAIQAVLRYHGRACLYAKCASTACREDAFPTASTTQARAATD
jgi:hypothetical protein